MNWTEGAYSTSPSLTASSAAADDSALAADCVRFRFVVNTLLIGALCVCGVVGNTLSVVVLHADRHNRVAVFLLQSLAASDNLVLCSSFVALSVVYGLLPAVDRGDLVGVMAPYLIKYLNPVGSAIECCTIWITVLLAVNRYVAVCRPFLASRWLTILRTRLQVGAVVIISALLNIPRFFLVNITHETVGGHVLQSNITGDNSSDTITAPTATVVRYYKTELSKNFYFEVIYLNAFYTSVVLMLPLVLVLVLNANVIRTLQRSKRRMRISSLEYDGRSENNITIVMIVIVLQLVLCHTPDRVVQVVWYLSDPESQASDCPHVIFYAYNISNLLVIVSSSTNFIIYFVFRRNFRAALRQRIFCRRRGPQTPSGGPGLASVAARLGNPSATSLPNLLGVPPADPRQNGAPPAVVPATRTGRPLLLREKKLRSRTTTM